MKKSLMSLMAVGTLLFFPVSADAVERIFTGSATYVVGSSESVKSVEQAILNEAKRNAIEQAGAYLNSITKVSNNTVTKDEITMITAGIAKLVPDSIEKNYMLIDSETGAISVKMTAKFVIDDEDVLARLNAKSQERDNEIKAYELYSKAMELVSAREMVLANNEQEENRNKTHTKKSFFDTTKGKGFDREAYIKRGEEGKKLLEPYKNIVPYVKQAIKLKPDFGEAYLFLGNWYQDRLKFATARKYYQRAMMYMPNNPEALYGMGLALSTLNDDDQLEAARFFSKAIQLSPNTLKNYEGRYACNMYLKHWNDAINDADLMLEIAQNKMEKMSALEKRAKAYTEKGDLDKALDDCETAMMIPYDSETWQLGNNRGTIYPLFLELILSQQNTIYSIISENMSDYNIAKYTQRLSSDIRYYETMADQTNDKFNKTKYIWLKISALRNLAKFVSVDFSHIDNYYRVIDNIFPNAMTKEEYDWHSTIGTERDWEKRMWTMSYKQ